MIVRDITIGMNEGGFWIFSDLTIKDSSFILPVTALTLSYLAFEISFIMSKKGGMLVFKNILQSMLILSVPLVLPLPAGVFCYWIPSSLFTVTQTLLLQTKTFNQILGIPIRETTKNIDTKFVTQIGNISIDNNIETSPINAPTSINSINTTISTLTTNSTAVSHLNVEKTTNSIATTVTDTTTNTSTVVIEEEKYK
jgi:YidC/Oxa1 family membrane protein insertase